MTPVYYVLKVLHIVSLITLVPQEILTITGAHIWSPTYGCLLFKDFGNKHDKQVKFHKETVNVLYATHYMTYCLLGSNPHINCFIGVVREVTVLGKA